uniref:Uncharacterized protein n=1 Tax=Zooxanthella nutricula TaxID=1333877 RepID=A0A6U9WMM6_9DINO
MTTQRLTLWRLFETSFLISFAVRRGCAASQSEQQRQQKQQQQQQLSLGARAAARAQPAMPLARALSDKGSELPAGPRDPWRPPWTAGAHASERARNFEVNEDFSTPELRQCCPANSSFLDLHTQLVSTTVEQMSVVVVEDKILMSSVVQQLASTCDVKQMPVLWWRQKLPTGKYRESHGGTWKADAKMLGKHSAELILKPSHMASARGVVKLSPGQLNGTTLATAATNALRMSPEQGGTKGRAAASVLPGVLVQPMYPAAPGSRPPHELKVLVVWGRAQVVNAMYGGLHSVNNLFFWRSGESWVPTSSPRIKNEALKESQTFEYEGQIQADAAKREALIRHLTPYVVEVAPKAECVAVRLRAPWLRVDFFVPPDSSSAWPVVLNEVEHAGGIHWEKGPSAEEMADAGPEEESIAKQDVKGDTRPYAKDIAWWVSQRDAARQRAWKELARELREGWAAQGERTPTAPRLTAFQEVGCAPDPKSKPGTPLEEYQAMVCDGSLPKVGAKSSSTKWWLSAKKGH